ncbi:MAG TPA: SDR family oxidoreductase [Thermoleophilaceae bacterium]|nr:SDR family oxidoreductase [Thermoleophilaceae bacterium]
MQVVAITGASAGVGRATARAFGERGASVGLLARGREGLEAAAREIEGAGGRALVLPTDVADPRQVEDAASALEDAFGPIDVWVNNAMTSVFARFWEIEADEYRRATEVTYLGVVNGTRAALRRMMPRDRGTIVQVGSALAYRGIPLQSAYCGAKHAIKGFTESLRTELMHDGSNVRLTMVQMPALNTPQFSTVRTKLPRHPQPVPPIYQPEVAAEAIVWAAEHERREVWVGRSTPIVIAGNHVAPAIGDRYLARTGFDSQQTDQPVNGDRPDNLFEPLPGDHGAHGEFDDRAAGSSVELWLSKHRRAVLGGVIGAGILALAARG